LAEDINRLSLRRSEPTEAAPGSPKRRKVHKPLQFVASHPQQKKVKKFAYIGKLKAGGPKTAFGELGLLNNKPRSATIKTETLAQFLTVDRTDFNQVGTFAIYVYQTFCRF
jgi:hypothetical protein